ncbi:MAG: hypothetical protein IJD09_00745 [Clostridia bacterium]|nr:hypothetical protein [Clostridia bacterium]
MMNSEAEAFFNTLPKWLREEILQSGVNYNTRSELEEIARNFATGAEEQKTQTE